MLRESRLFDVVPLKGKDPKVGRIIFELIESVSFKGVSVEFQN